LDAAIERTRLRVGTDVVRLPYVEEGHLWAALDACDVCVNLRSPTMGETSGIAIRALVLATPLVVSDVGWFAELPDSAVAKVPTDEWEVPTLAETLELLAGDARLRAKMAEAGRDYVRREHSLERCAELYAAALEEAAGKPLVREAVLREVAAAAAEVGLDAGSPELAEVGTALREVGLGD
jgi:glycosyltransferase involved in cell wall biosynthesis